MNIKENYIKNASRCLKEYEMDMENDLAEEHAKAFASEYVNGKEYNMSKVFANFVRENEIQEHQETVKTEILKYLELLVERANIDLI